MTGAWNPNPVTKLLTVVILSICLGSFRKDRYLLLTVAIFACFYILNGHVARAVKSMIFAGSVVTLSNLIQMGHENMALDLLISMLFVIKMFYLPLMAGRFMFFTTDVGAMVSAMDKLRTPRAVSIPIAVILRFYPAFREEHQNIRFAMKMRGITKRRPLAYVEYVMVPLLSISSMIADDIARYAETKALADPCQKVRYVDVRIRLCDLVFFSSVMAVLIVGSI
ncbi:MAG: energy-coupling factor transporter transmembrane component T [Eubacteriales bacterium]|nr:energy-coupling factor transporter transmembrane component T [Eubacteriales bacterium]